MVCYGSYQSNFYGIKQTYKNRYTWGSLPTTSQVYNTYKSELTGLYAIFSLMVSLFQLYSLQRREMYIG